MPQFCASCGAQMADGAAFCPACGKASGAATATGTAAAPAPATVAPVAAGMEDNVAGLLAYITIIPAIIFLVMEPFNKKPFVRFHAFQCIFLAVAWFALAIVLMILGFIPFVGFALLFLSPIIWILMLILAVVCMIKAYQGQMWKVPIIGNMAEKQAKNI